MLHAFLVGMAMGVLVTGVMSHFALRGREVEIEGATNTAFRLGRISGREEARCFKCNPTAEEEVE